MDGMETKQVPSRVLGSLGWAGWAGWGGLGSGQGILVHEWSTGGYEQAEDGRRTS